MSEAEHLEVFFPAKCLYKRLVDVRYMLPKSCSFDY